MALGVVVFDVQKVGRLLVGSIIPIQVAQPPVQKRVAGADVAKIALEVLNVDGLEKGRKVRLGLTMKMPIDDLIFKLTSKRIIVANLNKKRKVSDHVSSAVPLRENGSKGIEKGQKLTGVRPPRS